MSSPETKAGFEVQDFEADVIRRSADAPVLVDFWAAWCGPCRFLGPIVEKLASEADGRWALVKVDTERHPELAERYGIRGIPNLKLFHHGQVIAELPGALPEPQLREWIAQHLPGPGRQRLVEAKERLLQGNEQAAVPLLEEALVDEPTLDEARMLLARSLVLREPARVPPLLQHHKHLDGAPELMDLATALTIHTASLPEGPAREPVRQGMEALRNGDADAAMERWVEAVSRDKRYADELPRRLCVALLKLLGWEHPISERWRRRFHMALD